jgi:uncharacterized protein YjbI with pentapeptide repeats
MKASEVLRRYATGERDFRRINLRGQSFERQDLSGADFSEADIRGANFTNAILREANFTGAKAGLQKRWIVVLIVVMLFLSAISAFVSVFSSIPSSTSVSVFTSIPEEYKNVRFLALLGQAGFLFALTIFGGFQKALEIGAVFPAVAWSLTKFLGEREIIVPENAVLAVKSGILSGAVVGTWVLAIAGAMSITGAVFIAVIILNGRFTALIEVGVVTIVGAGAGIITGIISVTELEFQKIGLAASGIIIAAFLSVFIGWRILVGDKKFGWIWTFAINLATTGGTTYGGADLTCANFSKAILKGTNFNHTKQKQTILTQVCWESTKSLDLARLGSSILSNPAVRELLITRNGYKKSYVDANLRGADLNGVNLNEANLKWADLSEATLHYADLHGANLSETLVLGTDFKGASLTGACLEGWNIEVTPSLRTAKPDF